MAEHIEAFPNYEVEEIIGEERLDRIVSYRVFSLIELKNYTGVKAVIESRTERGAKPQDKVWHVVTQYAADAIAHCTHNWMGWNPDKYLSKAAALKLGRIISERVGQLNLAQYSDTDVVLSRLGELEQEIQAERVL